MVATIKVPTLVNANKLYNLFEIRGPETIGLISLADKGLRSVQCLLVAQHPSATSGNLWVTWYYPTIPEKKKPLVERINYLNKKSLLLQKLLAIQISYVCKSVTSLLLLLLLLLLLFIMYQIQPGSPVRVIQRLSWGQTKESGFYSRCRGKISGICGSHRC